METQSLSYLELRRWATRAEPLLREWITHRNEWSCCGDPDKHLCELEQRIRALLKADGADETREQA